MDINPIGKTPKVSISLSQRKIMFCDVVDEDSTFEFMNCINKLLAFDEKMGDKKPVEIMINSCGGSVYHGLTIMSKIEELIDMGYHIITTNIGMCFSMAFMIFICGNERRIYRYARCMYHDISTMVYGKLQEIREDLKESDELIGIIDKKVVEVTNLKKEELIGWRERKIDKYFSATESIEYGIADIIV